MPVIEAKSLRKEYRINKKKEGLRGAIINLLSPKYMTKVAVDNISFSIDEGEVVGYIGANGAGKSTTIKMLTGILTPTSGEVRINGLIPHKNRIRNNMQIGTIFGQRTQLWWDIPVVESYKLIQSMYEVPKEKFDKNLEEYTELLDLKDLLNIPVRQLSLGQKMRCEIGAAFIYDPKIVYLDEPTIGLDVVVKEKIRKFIKELNRKKNTTIILTTHDMQDIEEICSRVIIIDNGNIIYNGSLDEIKSRFGKYRMMNLTVNDSAIGLENALKLNNSFIHGISMDNNEIVLKFDGMKTTAVEVANLVSSYCTVVDMKIAEPSIESIVMDLYGKKG